MSTSGNLSVALQSKTRNRARPLASALKSREAVLLLVDAFIFITLAIARPTAFANWINFKAVLSLMVYDLLLAVGMTTVLILRGIDLSVGSVLALSSVVMALLMQAGIAVVPSLFAGLVVVLACGFFNGFLTAVVGILPFLVTLGMMSLARGAATVMTSGKYISFPNTSEWFISFGRLEIPFWHGAMTYGFPVPLLIVLLITALYAVLLKRWRVLRQMFLVGENEEAARLSGLNTVGITIAGYLICTLFVWFAAVLLISSNRIGYANYGVQSEMRAIAAAVVGGASFAGGSGSIVGTFLGVLMFALIGNGFILLSGDPNWQQATTGVVLILAVAADAIRTIRDRKN
jgi:ribose transport system permease protein